LFSLDNVDTNWADDNGRTLLYLAADGGHDDVVYHILQRPDTRTDTTDESGRTPLAVAAFKGHEDVVKQLLKHGVDGNSRDKGGRTALSLAAHRGHHRVVDELIVHQQVEIETVEGKSKEVELNSW